jgi:sarcosine oxidase subunit alpha
MSMGAFRLPSPAGLLIDRNRPLSFRFEGRPYGAFAGDTIASALAAQGEYLLSRSFKYHRPRGLLTAAGQDGHCLVQVEDEPNVRADCRLVAENMNVLAQHYRGTLARDRHEVLDRLDRFMPPGFYYRAFFRPQGVWQRVWEPLIRARSGSGRVNLAARRATTEKQFLFCDVAVVGAGPAGMTAALAAARGGAEVLLIEENPYLGGALAYARFDVEGVLAARRRDQLIDEVEREPRIRLLREAVCTGWFADNWLSVLGKDRLFKVRAVQAVLATGLIEQPIVFRNNDLPGIMQGSAAQRLIRLYGVKPGNRSVVLAGHDDAYGVALDLAEAAVEIAAVVELRRAPPQTPLANEIRRRGLPILPGHRIDGAQADRSGLRVAQCTVDGASLDCDLVCMCAGYMPAYQLPAQAGFRIDHDESRGTLALRDPPAGCRVAGSLRGCVSLEAVLADGERAGSASAPGAGATEGGISPPPDDLSSAPLPWPIYPHAKGKDFVDFDEDLQVADLCETVRAGYSHMELVKRYSTVGMGPSQGRQSALNAARIVARETGRPVTEVGLTTARPPVVGEPLHLLAGHSFHPERLTPMHYRHLDLGARMIAVGPWWRPLYYGTSELDAAAEVEMAAVHGAVGMVDVSTLGKFEIRGPDAAAFIERFYTGAFADQRVGRIRYLLATNEAGAIVDDGIGARLSDQHFYLTATTGAADATLRQMLWWNAQWRLKVDITNVTSGFAAINLAGPRSREVLEQLSGDIDLSRDGFPHMHAREGRLEGVPVRVMRIGFLGELAFEIHVPSSFGEALWDRILAAGEPHAIKPVGVEAQRRLRLEKGHIIIGQDTDGQITPRAAGLGWAVAQSKTFFVGSRSLALRAKLPLKRRLIGFTQPLEAPVPPEWCLVVREREMVGIVTSAARSRACGAVVGLALVEPGLAALQSEIAIRLPGGRRVTATVAKPPFYDPKNERQRL